MRGDAGWVSTTLPLALALTIQVLRGPNPCFHAKDLERTEWSQRQKSKRNDERIKALLHSVRCKMIDLLNSPKRRFRGDLISAYEYPHKKEKFNRGLSRLGEDY